MDLPTHAAFGLAIGLVFFGHPEAAVLVMIGAILPDLDRDWLAKKYAIGEEQRHRAILHNVFVVAIAFLLSPFLALGVFLHMLQDSFTTANDKGCEWFYPLSRLVKRGKYDANKNPVPLDSNEQIYFLQEDPETVVDGPAIPWRRVYGPAQNSMILDRIFLVGSLIAVGVWFGFTVNSDLLLLASDLSLVVPHLVLLLAFVVLLISGFLLRDKVPSSQVSSSRITAGLIGIALAVLWGFYAKDTIIANVETLSSNLLPILVGGVLIAFASWAVIMWHARKYKPAAVV